MKTKRTWKKNLPIILIGGLLPTIVILSLLFDISKPLTILLLVVLGLVFGAMLMWKHATKDADGSEWWQDDDASGWRGY